MRTPLVLLLAAAALGAQPARPSPEAFYQQAVRTSTSREGLGEDFCWQSNYNLHQFLKAYQAWDDTAWLDWGVKYYDYLLSKIQTGPDGYPGWIGPYEYDKSVWCDVHVGDAILLNGMLAFSEVALKDPELKAQYGAAAERYVALAKRVMEKWDRRGTFHEDGPFGAYVSWNRYGEPGDLKDWKSRGEISRSTLSLPFNKQNDMALVALKLWRITGEPRWRERAERIFAFMKSRFHYLHGHYAWNYWEPFGPWDVDLNRKTTLHWVGVHPYRNYQDGEVSQIVEAYQSGVVFDRADLERITRTNLDVMWNHDRERPQFVNSDADYRAREPVPRPGEGKAGILWAALAGFDQTVRDLCERRLQRAAGARGAIERAWYENVTRKRPLDPPPAKPEPFPWGESKELNLAAALDSGRLLVSNSVVPGDLEIALYAGGVKKEVLHQAPHSTLVIYRWDMAGVPPGEYRIRWTFLGGYREFPVRVR